MKIAVCSQGEGLKAQVDSRFGRCLYFVIVDLDTDQVETVDNPAIKAGHGAGPEAAQALADKDVEAVCANHVGPNAYGALQACGIAMYTADPTKTVADTVEDFKAGKLERHSSVEGGGQGRRNR